MPVMHFIYIPNASIASSSLRIEQRQRTEAVQELRESPAEIMPLDRLATSDSSEFCRFLGEVPYKHCIPNE
eukprot:scaffold383222_cov38-Prasinocladus_malaysianus.AAC.1